MIEKISMAATLSDEELSQILDEFIIDEDPPMRPPKPPIKKRKKFPWLVIGALILGFVVGYFVHPVEKRSIETLSRELIILLDEVKALYHEAGQVPYEEEEFLYPDEVIEPLDEPSEWDFSPRLASIV